MGKKFKGTVTLSIGEYNRILNKAVILDNLKAFINSKTDEAIEEKMEKAEDVKTVYISDSVFISLDDICTVTGWDNYNEVIAVIKRAKALVESRKEKKEIINNTSDVTNSIPDSGINFEKGCEVL